jgi:hypothetical protein
MSQFSKKDYAGMQKEELTKAIKQIHKISGFQRRWVYQKQGLERPQGSKLQISKMRLNEMARMTKELGKKDTVGVIVEPLSNSEVHM